MSAVEVNVTCIVLFGDSAVRWCVRSVVVVRENVRSSATKSSSVTSNVPIFVIVVYISVNARSLALSVFISVVLLSYLNKETIQLLSFITYTSGRFISFSAVMQWHC